MNFYTYNYFVFIRHLFRGAVRISTQLRRPSWYSPNPKEIGTHFTNAYVTCFSLCLSRLAARRPVVILPRSRDRFSGTDWKRKYPSLPCAARSGATAFTMSVGGLHVTVPAGKPSPARLCAQSLTHDGPPRDRDSADSFSAANRAATIAPTNHRSRRVLPGHFGAPRQRRLVPGDAWSAAAPRARRDRFTLESHAREGLHEWSSFVVTVGRADGARISRACQYQDSNGVLTSSMSHRKPDVIHGPGCLRPRSSGAYELSRSHGTAKGVPANRVHILLVQFSRRGP